MAIINILDLDLYLINFMDTNSIIKCSEINKKSYMTINKLNLYKQIISHYKQKNPYFTIITYSAQNDYIELFKHLVLVEKKPFGPMTTSSAVQNCSVKILKWLFEHKYQIGYSENDIDVLVYDNNPNLINILPWLLDPNYSKNINAGIIINQYRIDILIFLKKNNVSLSPYTINDIDYYDITNRIDIILWLMSNHFIEPVFSKLILKLANFCRNDFIKIYPQMLTCAIENNLISFKIFLSGMIKAYG